MREDSRYKTTDKAYYGRFTDTKQLRKSSSGGAATALSYAMIRNGGSVFGCKYSSDFKNVEYVQCNTAEELSKLRETKYTCSSLQVNMDGKEVPFYIAVGKLLSEGKQVLTIGLGCEIGMLLAYLNKKNIDTTNLYSVDIICQGPTPNDFHQQFIEWIEKKYKSRIVSFSVRYKKHGWVPPYLKVNFENGKTYEHNYYNSYYGFAMANYARPQCYNCHFKGIHHCADITIGDAWGLKQGMDDYCSEGVSAIIVHTEKGKELLDRIDENSFLLKIADLNYIIDNNPMYYKSREKTECYENYKRNLTDKGFIKATMVAEGYLKFILRRVKRALYGQL